MKNLFEAARVEEVKQRTARLRPDCERQWGKPAVFARGLASFQLRPVPLCQVGPGFVRALQKLQQRLSG